MAKHREDKITVAKMAEALLSSAAYFVVAFKAASSSQSANAGKAKPSLFSRRYDCPYFLRHYCRVAACAVQDIHRFTIGIRQKNAQYYARFDDGRPARPPMREEEQQVKRCAAYGMIKRCADVLNITMSMMKDAGIYPLFCTSPRELRAVGRRYLFSATNITRSSVHASHAHWFKNIDVYMPSFSY